MSPRAAVTALGVAALAAPAGAQPRPLDVTLGLTLRADASAATREIALRRNDIARCFDDAAGRTADRLASLRRVVVTLQLDRQGRASTVVIDPPLLSPGLSECLATTLLAWRQGGRVGRRAVVRLVINR